MYLKSLELQGFKSFPDKIKLDFGKGLTAVVGPNGSGKSNIGDAVRWVLGEQSSKTLRGGKMEDVIFSGTQLRKSVGFAAVTLNIDNTARKLPVDNDLVSVTRKLYRSGESEYLINGQNVRLKDIIELFMDTGLGRDGYSIIGQGRVAEIVSSKSNERREIFEEAAGISKFRYKKEEAERRLSSAYDNILRLRDIIAELEARVEPLRIQSEKATKFISLSEEKKVLEISVWLHKLEELKLSLNDFEEKFLMSNSEYEAVENEIEKLEDAVNLAYRNMQNSTVKAEDYRSRILEIERSNSQVFAEIAVFENDIVHLNNSIITIQEKQEQSKLSGEQTNDLIINQQKKLEEIQILEAKCSDEIEISTNAFDQLNFEANEFDNNFNSKNIQLNSLYIKKSGLDFSINSTKSTLEETKQNIESALLQQTEISDAINVYEKEKSELELTLSQINEQYSEHSNKLNGFNLLLERKSNQLESAKNEFSQTDMKIRELKQKSQLLSDLENSMEGFAHSVKEIVRAGKNRQISGIRGTVAQLIKVDTKYSVAIETALGAALQNVIVENEDTAKRCINLLKEQNAGRATFLPITSVKGYALNENGLESQDGYIALASEIVSYDNEFLGIIRSLLGRIVIVEDIDLATAISKKFGYRFKIVTLDGQVINAGGSFTGGSTSRSTGVLTRKNEIDSISHQLLSLTQGHNELKAKVFQLQSEVDKLGYDVEGEKFELSNINSDKIRFDSEMKHTASMLEQIQSKSIEIENLISNLDKKSEAQKNQIESLELELVSCIEIIRSIESEISQTQTKKDDFNSQRIELSEKLSQSKMKQIELKKDKEACILYLDQLRKSVEDHKTSLDEFMLEIEETKAKILEKHEQINAKKLSLDDKKSSVEKIDELIKLEQQKHEDFEREANEKRNAQKIKNEEKETFSREMARLQERKLSIQKDYDNIISELWEQYQLSRSHASVIAVEITDINASQKQLNEVKNKIRGLGNVNVSAIEEYKEVAERYEYLSKQLSDVEHAKKELEDLIENLTESMRIMFTESFNEINNNFKSIFVELFGGGHAELTLTDPSNVLESGIEINVAPPGKVIKSLSLLSGGEQAFIAIAIYFSILKLKPSPFCVLDEIEAALDDVNVAKYAAYLRNFTNTTQFIVITHRRGTMEEADVLYGVTMQEKGISKLLKMDNKDSVRVTE